MNRTLLLLVAVAVAAFMGCNQASGPAKQKEETPDVYVKGSGLVNGKGIEIVSKDQFDWTDVTATLNDRYTCHLDVMNGWSTKVIPMSDFKDSSGQPFDRSKEKPRKLTIHCQTPQGKGMCEGEWEE